MTKNELQGRNVIFAVADILVAVFLTPQYIFRRLFSHPAGVAGDFVCKFFTGGFLTWLGGAASAFTLVAISFERHYVVHHNRHITSRKLKAVIAASWVYALVVELPPVIAYQYNSIGDFCVEAWPSSTYPKVYTVITFLLDFGIPTALMTYFHARAVQTLRQQTKHVTNHNSQQFAALNAKKRVTIMVVIVTAIYSACWLPDVTSYLLAYYHPEFRYGSVLYHTAVVFVCVSSCVNPFVYSWQSGSFRRHLKKAIGWKQGSNQITTTTLQEVCNQSRSSAQGKSLGPANNESV
ncbi:G-protein coupled receptor 83 isoform X2 [Nematostella vectensis]|uniref:G-protein coupled receptor 83 isoform X2 n=1 Tax=Nematostella vectensis TaxID=45351 RepID=UPI0020772921|nr:G-protein coupled receptor 83 isoform X2 [Nematostella vectensis]